MVNRNPHVVEIYKLINQSDNESIVNGGVNLSNYGGIKLSTC